MLSPDDVLTTFTERKKHYRPLHDAMLEIDKIYDNEAEIPLPDAGKNVKPSIPNLLAQGVDQTAGRIASVIPQVTFAPAEGDKRTAERKAKTASRTITAWWQRDRLPWKLRRRARHLIAYGMSPTMVRYNTKTKRPTWIVRDPRTTYPSMEEYGESFCPQDVIFAFRRNVKWLVPKGYSEQIMKLTGQPASRLNDSTQLRLLEHVDHYGSCLYLAGFADPARGHYDGGLWTPDTWDARSVVKTPIVLLERQVIPEEAYVMQASVPYRVALNGPQSQFESMVSSFYAQARLWALELLAVEKGIFPDTWIMGDQNNPPTIEEGPHDGRTGLVNLARGRLESITYAPGYMTQPSIDRLERNSRLNAGIPSEFGGESGDNIRTARRGDAVLSGMIDHPIAEAQEVLALALQDENRAAIELAKIYDGDISRSIYVNVGNDSDKVTYKTTEVFAHSEHTVSYPLTGTDVNSLIMMNGQRVGLGIQSKRTAMYMDPVIANPEKEHDQIIVEGIESAMVAQIQAQAQSGAIPPLVLSRIMQLVQQDKLELPEAMQKAMQEAMDAQAEQAAQAQAGPQDPAQAAAGATQAALTGSPVPGPTPGQEDVADLLATIRQPNMTIQPQRGVAEGAL